MKKNNDLSERKRTKRKDRDVWSVLACVLRSASPSRGTSSLFPPAPSSPAPSAPLQSVAALLLLSFFRPPSSTLLPAVREVENAKGEELS